MSTHLFDGNEPVESTPLVHPTPTTVTSYTNIPSDLRVRARPPPSENTTTDSDGTKRDEYDARQKLTIVPSSPTSQGRPESSSRQPSPLSLKLENHGGVARDHLASERTFLAYVRTSLALTSSGVALVQLFTVSSVNRFPPREGGFHMYIRPLGAMTIVMGLMVLLIGAMRYFSIQAALTTGNFPVARVVIVFITLGFMVLLLLTFGILIAGELESRGLG